MTSNDSPATPDATDPPAPGRVAVPPWPARPCVRAMMITSLDGSAAGPDGQSGSLGGAADRGLLSDLRATADVVLVGRATAQVEGYRPVRLPDLHWRQPGQQPRARLAIVTGGGLDAGMGAFADPAARPLVVTSAAGAEIMPWVPPEDLLVAGAVQVDLAAAVAGLARIGLGRIVCEGGPGLLGSLLRGRLIDELCLTLSPMTVGGGPGLVTGGVPVDRWDLTAWPMREGFLFLHYRRHG